MAEVCTLSGRVSLVIEALSAPLQGGLRLLRRSFTPSAIPVLAVGIPPPRDDGTNGAYPVVQCGEADGAAASYSPAGHVATVVEGSTRRSDPRAILAPACQHLWPVLDDGPWPRTFTFVQPTILCWAASGLVLPDCGRCPRSFKRRIAPSPVRVAALGWTRLPHGILPH